MLNYYLSKYSVQNKKTRDTNYDIVYDEIIKTVAFILIASIDRLFKFNDLVDLKTVHVWYRSRQSTVG